MKKKCPRCGTDVPAYYLTRHGCYDCDAPATTRSIDEPPAEKGAISRRVARRRGRRPGKTLRFTRTPAMSNPVMGKRMLATDRHR